MMLLRALPVPAVEPAEFSRRFSTFAASVTGPQNRASTVSMPSPAFSTTTEVLSHR
jgi:hypothetical protein